MKTIIVWFRNDLRLHDHPALAAAISGAEAVIPVFIFDDLQLQSDRRSSNRNRFLLECLDDLQQSLAKAGARLVFRTGPPENVLPVLVRETGAEAVYYSADFTPYAIKRDKTVKKALCDTNTAFRGFPGRLIVNNVDAIRANNGNIYTVFTPYYKKWQQALRRPRAEAPTTISSATVTDYGVMPNLSDITDEFMLSPHVLPGGETTGRERLHSFLSDGIQNYQSMHNDLASDGTSRLSPYLHFGCLSALEIETLLPDTEDANVLAWHRQLAWREFYNYVLYHYPDNARHEFQERYRSLTWNDDDDMLEAWKTGRTGYPIVDAGMRQLRDQGWMHNRARLIVGSFLTKDLGIDWRAGEAHFMRMLLDGDEANNNGNWQWISSVGVDPAPVFRRLYNPASQQATHDPTGQYVRRHVPELSNVPDKYLAEPSTMPEDVQRTSGCIIGRDYPAPIVNHQEARKLTLELFRQTAAAYQSKQGQQNQ